MARLTASSRSGSVLAATPLALPGQRIGLLGGSFNPPHAAHVAVSETALRRLKLDRVWWLVTPGNPLKANDALPAPAKRIAACRALVRDPRIEVTGFEAALGSPFTVDTVRFLTRRYPGVRFVWIMGADGLAGFHRWRRWRTIAARVAIAVVDRPGWRLAALASPAARALARSRVPEARAAGLLRRKPPAWTYLATRLSGTSSSAIRARRRT